MGAHINFYVYYLELERANVTRFLYTNTMAYPRRNKNSRNSSQPSSFTEDPRMPRVTLK